jgi:putative transcriptional regulator
VTHAGTVRSERTGIGATMEAVPPSTRGRLLVASPDLVDPNFRRTVVLVLTHDAEGAVGLVLNRPTDIAIGEALPRWVDVTAPPACLYVGGPVQPDAAIGLGFGGTVGDDPLLGLMGAVDLDGEPDTHRAVRVFIGYAGWGPGQLDSELARDDWLVVDAEIGDVSTAAPAALWRDVLRRQRGRASLLATAPDDASLN